MKRSVGTRKHTHRLKWFFGVLGGISLFTSYILVFLMSGWTNRFSFSPLIFILLLCIELVSLFFYLVVIRLENQNKNYEYQVSVEKANQHLEQSKWHLDFLFDLSHNLIKAKDELEIADLLLSFNIEFIGACGASFVPLDSYGKPLAVIKKGELPNPQIEAWMEYIATPEVRNKCGNCSQYGIQTDECYLLDYQQIAISSTPRAEKIFCMPIKYADKDLGILNIFLPDGRSVDRTTNSFLKMILEQTGAAIEVIRLRNREQNLVESIDKYKQTHEIVIALTSLIDNLLNDYKSDFLCLIVFAQYPFEEEIKIISGARELVLDEVIDTIVSEVCNTNKALFFESSEIESIEFNQDFSIIATPVLNNDESILGVLINGKASRNICNQDDVSILQETTSNIAFMLQYSNVFADVEYYAILQERKRLAREIHDGLAQTLGFLKLQTAKMKNLIVREDFKAFQDSLDLHYKTLGAAYLDAREAIDNLHLNPSQLSFDKWLPEQIVLFREMSDIRVDSDLCELNFEMPVEVQAQLFRILQEAFSNVRKHSKADRVMINCNIETDYLNINICDNGIGFSTDEVTYVSQYGLMGMYERAQLIGAEIQINSAPFAGTTIHIQIPIKNHQQELLA